MKPLIQDARYSIRLMRRRPGTTLLVLMALALGIGLNAAIFTVVNAVLLRPLPISDPDRVMRLYAKVNRTGATLGISYPEYLDWKTQSRSFEAIAAMRALSFMSTSHGRPEHLKATAISASGFRAWGIDTVVGRGFTDDDDRPDSNRAVVLNHTFWMRKFGGDSSVLGTPLVLDEHPYTIIGVLQTTQLGILQYPDIWVANGPLLDANTMRRDNRFYFPVARLRPDVAPGQAQAEIERVANLLALQYPETNKDMGVRFVSQTELLTSDGRKPLLLLITASSLIFVLAAVNVMTVFMGAAIERTQELSTRLALGSSRLSLARQLFAHAFIIGSIGGALGLLLAKLILVVFVHRFPNAVQRFQETKIDFRVIVVTIAMTALGTLLCTIAPVMYAIGLKIKSEFRGERNSFDLTRHRTLGRSILILFEVSLATGLSLVSGLLIKSLYQAEKVDLGFSPHGIISFRIDLPPSRYKEPTQQSAFYKLALEKLSHLAGMRSTSGISGLPLTNQGEVNRLDVDSQSPLSGNHLIVDDESILPGFFQSMGLSLLKGRDFTDADQQGTPPVIIVDDALAAKLWPNQNPLGKRVSMAGLRNNTPRWLEVVGVVREIKHFGPEQPVRWMQVYVPQYQDPTPMLSFVVNTTIPEAAVKGASEKAFHELDKDLPLESFQSMDAYLNSFLTGRKLSLILLNGLAAIAVTLGMIGIYGAVANSVIQRQREIAVRMALGATPFRIAALVTRFGLINTLAGILIGCAIVASLTKLLGSLLFGVRPLDTTVYMITAIIVIMVAVLASASPAVRLFRFNIQEILRR